MRSCLCIFLFLSAQFFTLNTSAEDWYEYRSENFTVYSDVPEKQVIKMLRELERFRHAALTFTGLADFPENQKLRVVHFNDSDEFRGFSGDGKIAGFYRETWDGPVIFSREDGHGISGSGLMFHEYVHHLMRERSAMTYPRWYSEGFAELLASAELREDVVVIGGVPGWRLSAWANPDEGPVALHELLNPPKDREGGRYWNNFYASSWLFTHYLQLGHHSGNPDYLDATTRYLQAVADGAEPSEVFEEYFGKTIPAMQREVLRYMRADIHRYRFNVPPYTYSIPRRFVSNNARIYLLAEKARELGKLDLALGYLEQSEPHNSGWVENRVAMANIKHQQKQPAAAEKILKDVDEHGQVSGRAALQLARWYIGRLQTLSATRNWRDEDYQAAVKYGKLAIQLDAQQLAGYRYLWTAHQLKGDRKSATQIMMAAYELDATHLPLNREMGFYLAHIGERELAREFLLRVLAWSHSVEVRKHAEKVLQELDLTDNP